jgi:hypothetical protein
MYSAAMFKIHIPKKVVTGPSEMLVNIKRNDGFTCRRAELRILLEPLLGPQELSVP